MMPEVTPNARTVYVPFHREWHRLLFIVLLVLLTRGVMIARTEVPSRDCLIFCRYARQLDQPPLDPQNPARRFSDAKEVIQRSDHPPGFPFAIWGMGKLLSQIRGPLEPTDYIFAAQLVSAFAAIFMIFPHYWIGRRYLGAAPAFWGTLLFAMIPVFAEVSSDGLSDTLYLATITTAVWFAVAGNLAQNFRSALAWFTASGFACGVAFLIRPDALMVFGLIGLFLFIRMIMYIRTRVGAQAMIQGLAMLLGAILFAAPYVSVIGKLTNKRTGLGLLDYFLTGEMEKTFYQRAEPQESKLPGIVAQPFAAWYHQDKHGHLPKVVWALKALVQEICKTSFYILFCLSALALIFRFRQSMTRTGILLLFLMVGYLVQLVYVSSMAGYLSQRHTLFPVMCMSFFAIQGFFLIGQWAAAIWKKGTPMLWTTIYLTIAVASTLPLNFKALHAHRVGHRAVGMWMYHHVPANAEVMDPFGWAKFYAGKSDLEFGFETLTVSYLLQNGYSPAEPNAEKFPRPYRGPVIYVVFEPNSKTSHSQLPYIAEVREFMKQGELVYQYPEDVPANEAKVAVYRCPPSPEP
ncbi:MAG: glycosyltransferase family 39 protein [Zavarzinella sp.]